MALNNEQNPFENVVNTLNKIISDNKKILEGNKVTEEAFFKKQTRVLKQRYTFKIRGGKKTAHKK